MIFDIALCWASLDMYVHAHFAFVLRRAKMEAVFLGWIFSPMIASRKYLILFFFFYLSCQFLNMLLIIPYHVSCCKVVACSPSYGWSLFISYWLTPAVVSVQVIQAVFFGICVLTDLSSLLTRGNGNQEQERQLKKLISLRDWMLAVLAFPVGVVSIM